MFKIGEHYAYFKIARGIQNLKDHADLLDQVGAEGVMDVEKIDNQYYAYVDNNFVGQCSERDQVKSIVENLIKNNPGRYSKMHVRIKE